MNRYPLLCLESEGRGGEVMDGIESLHFSNHKRKRENELQSTDISKNAELKRAQKKVRKEVDIYFKK